MSEAERITRALNGQWHNRYGVAPCPVCQPQARPDQNALTLTDGYRNLLLNCKRSACSFIRIMGALRVLGLVDGVAPAPRFDPAEIARRRADSEAKARRQSDAAWRIWREAQEFPGTAAEAYLRGRGITADLPDTLRFHPACPHPSRNAFPAVIARVDGAAGFAIHRTFIRPDGGGKADVGTQKAMLGATAGGHVTLAEAAPALVVAEGIETGLALASGLLPGLATIWAALSTSGLSSLNLPPRRGKLVIATDGDAAGHDAGRKLVARAERAGWEVRLRPAPEGRDWADVLALRARRE